MRVKYEIHPFSNVQVIDSDSVNAGFERQISKACFALNPEAT